MRGNKWLDESLLSTYIQRLAEQKKHPELLKVLRKKYNEEILGDSAKIIKIDNETVSFVAVMKNDMVFTAKPKDAYYIAKFTYNLKGELIKQLIKIKKSNKGKIKGDKNNEN